MRHRPRNTTMLGQQLEQRHLLAANLAIQVDDYAADVAGAEVSRVIRVVNHGDETADDAFIQSVLSDQLSDANWTRETFSPRRVDQPDLSEADLVVRGNRSDVGRHPVLLGDVNGDGFADFGVSAISRHFVVFGAEGGTRVQVTDEALTTEPDALDATELKSQNRFASWKVLGDTDGDGFDDFTLDNTVVLGRTDLASLGSMEVPPGIPSFRQLGDINGDGVTDSWRIDSDLRQSFVELGATSDQAARSIRIVDDPRFTGSFRLLGDINGDGIDDFKFNRFVIFGNANLGSSTSIRLAELPSSEAISHNQFFDGTGDINGDGVDDLLVEKSRQETRIVWGGEQIAEYTDLTLAPGIDLNVYASPFTQIKDINGDGYDDFSQIIFESNEIPVLLGGPLPDAADDSERSFSVPIPSQFRQNVSFVVVDWDMADLNGDGVEDLLLSLDGGDCSPDCTAVDRGFIDSTGGALVVYGHSDIGQATEVQPDVVLQVTFPSLSRRPDSRAVDRNADGIADIVMTAGNREYVVFGGEQLQSHDFGYLHSGGLTSDEGYVAMVDSSQFEIDAGVDDSIHQWVATRWPNEGFEVYLDVSTTSAGTSPQVSGQGDIADSVGIGPNEEVIYRVTGQWKADAIDHLMATVSAEGLGENPADNVFPRDQAAAQLEVAVELSDFVPNSLVDQEVEAIITIKNEGPFDAQYVHLDEALSERLRNVTWQTNIAPFPPSSDEPSLLGPQIHGVDVDPAAFRRLEELGSRVGTLGDINGDGFSELFASTVLGLRVFWGNESADLSDSTLIEGAFSNIRALGDVDSDGLADFSVGSSGGSSYIVFGSNPFPKDPSVSVPDLRNERLGNLLKNLTPAGDIDGDGNQDWIADAVIYLGTESGIFDGQALVATQIKSTQPLIAIGDVNDDGRSDFAINNEDGDILVGFGRAEFAGQSIDWTAESNHKIDDGTIVSICASCGSGQDINGDEVGDLIFVGRTKNFEYGVYAIFGGVELPDTTTDLNDIQASQGFAIKVGDPDLLTLAVGGSLAVGDFIGDNKADIAIGTIGELTIVSAANLGGTIEWEDIQADQNHEVFQLSYPSLLPLTVSAVGDVTGDGVDDLVVGDSPPEFWLFDGYAGQMHLIKGRIAEHLVGNGRQSIPDLNIPIGGSARISIRGVLAAGENLTGRVSVVPDASTLLLKPSASAVVIPHQADLNSDGFVDFADFLILSGNFGATEASREVGDIDDDGIVGFSDFLILSSAFNQS